MGHPVGRQSRDMGPAWERGGELVKNGMGMSFVDGVLGTGDSPGMNDGTGRVATSGAMGAGGKDGMV